MHSQTSSLSTSLFSQHQQLGAQMVDFAGWSMPLRYRSQQQEHLAVRTAAGMFDVSHMLGVHIRGKDARTLARVVLSNDIDKVTKPGGAIYGCLLNDKGGVVDDTIWWVFTEFDLLVVCNASRRDADLAWLKQHADGLDVAIDPMYQHGIIALQGPNARAIFARVTGINAGETLSPMQAQQTHGMIISRTGYSGEDGLELIVPHQDITELWQKLLDGGVQPCGLGARDTLRLEAGMCLYGNELTEAIGPMEAGIKWCVDFSDPQRNFTGKKALQQLQANDHMHQIGVVLPKGGVLRSGYNLCNAKGETVGTITSGGYSPMMKQSIGLARVKPNSGDSLSVSIRDKLHSVQSVAPPFVRKGKVRYPEYSKA